MVAPVGREIAPLPSFPRDIQLHIRRGIDRLAGHGLRAVLAPGFPGVMQCHHMRPALPDNRQERGHILRGFGIVVDLTKVDQSHQRINHHQGRLVLLDLPFEPPQRVSRRSLEHDMHGRITRQPHLFKPPLDGKPGLF